MEDREVVGLGILDVEGIICCIDLDLPFIPDLEVFAYLYHTHEDDLFDNLLNDLVRSVLAFRILYAYVHVRNHEVGHVQTIFDLDILLDVNGFFEEGSNHKQVFLVILIHEHICNQQMVWDILHFWMICKV